MGDIRHEQRAPATVFSVVAFSQVQLRADCLPHEPVMEELAVSKIGEEWRGR